MTVLVTTEAVVIALLAVLVAGLLRSHAEILRALHRLEGGSASSVSTPVAAPRRVTTSSSTAFDLIGAAPDDGELSISVVGARADTLLAFLSSGCATCSRFWEAFVDEALPGLPPGARLVVVTRGPGEESPARIRGLAPRHVPVVMTDAAWDDYGVPGAPYFVYVDGAEGRVAGRGDGRHMGRGGVVTGRRIGGRPPPGRGGVRGRPGQARRRCAHGGRHHAGRPAAPPDGRRAGPGVGPG